MKSQAKEPLRERIAALLLTVVAALAVALGMHVFIYPADFAPSGVDGLATVLQTLTGINAGLFTAAINLPLLIAAWFILKRRYVLYTLLYTVFLSFFLILLARVDFYAYHPHGERLIPAIFGGIAHGLTGIMLRLGASSGGVDIIAGMIQKRLSHKEVEKIISLISFVTVGLSYLVYENVESALLSVVEIVICERITTGILRNTRTLIKCEIYAPRLSELRGELHLHFPAEQFPTEVDASVQASAKGDGSSKERQRLLCVIRHRQLPELLRVLRKFPDATLYYSDVMGVIGTER